LADLESGCGSRESGNERILAELDEMIPAVFFPGPLQDQLIRQELVVREPHLLKPMTDEDAMRLAIQEAYRGLGFVSPNPLVGCVILDSQSRFLAKGFHAQYGESHAEIQALKSLKTEDLKGAKVFVTLEPCAHQGKTPACAKTLAQLPIQKLVYGLIDPNPLVAGLGLEILKAAGIEVTEFQGLKAQLEEVCEHFLWNFRQQKVFVSLKVASSLDGQLALKTGESKWITDETSRQVAHLLRAAHDAILVGANTVLVDNPSLDIRSGILRPKTSKVIILDPKAVCLSQIKQLQLMKVHHPRDVYFVISDQISSPPNSENVQVIKLPDLGLGLDLNLLLTKLWQDGIRSLLVEGGAQVLSSFISESKAQRMYLFQAPMILGAKSGKAWTEQVNIGSMAGRISLKNQQFIPLATDLLITGNLH
jgi:diaminohydroxyphosphoribosylaminopyrimidine deaminase/5-amino-6-(5-phosphoribosylamino)uracil reductase